MSKDAIFLKQTKQVYSANAMPGYQHTEASTHTCLPIKIIKKYVIHSIIQYGVKIVIL